MKYAISILVGFVVGAILFVGGFYFNPFTEQLVVSPLAVARDQQLDFTYTAVANESILYTDHGESNVKPHPDRVAELWEPAIADTSIAVTVLEDGRGDVAGIGIKFSTDSEQTALIRSEILYNSAWHIYAPGEGTLFIDQVENYWSYLREVVVPARWSSGDNWRGTFFRIMTQGPFALGTARVTGGTGNFSGLSGEAVESLTARAFATDGGLVSADGELTVSLAQFTDDSE
jgi:hypothetical protein